MSGTPAEPITGATAEAMGEFGQFAKVATTRISLFTVLPGVPYQTPEGLRAEDEPTRIAFDVQGGVYPIRESVFAASYRPAQARTAVPEIDAARLAEAWGNVMDGRRIVSPLPGVPAARIGRDTTTSEDWRAIASEYAAAAPQEPE